MRKHIPQKNHDCRSETQLSCMNSLDLDVVKTEGIMKFTILLMLPLLLCTQSKSRLILRRVGEKCLADVAPILLVAAPFVLLLLLGLRDAHLQVPGIRKLARASRAKDTIEY